MYDLGMQALGQDVHEPHANQRLEYFPARDSRKATGSCRKVQIDHGDH